MPDIEELSAIVVDEGYKLHEALGLVMNFGAPTFKSGVRRVVNGHPPFASSRLRAMQNPNLDI